MSRDPNFTQKLLPSQLIPLDPELNEIIEGVVCAVETIVQGPFNDEIIELERQLMPQLTPEQAALHDKIDGIAIRATYEVARECFLAGMLQGILRGRNSIHPQHLETLERVWSAG